MSEEQRRLAAIVFTDIQGYTAMAQRNEKLAMELVDEQARLLRPVFGKHGGKEIKMIGDAFLVEFPSALLASDCAVEIQTALRLRNSSMPEERRIPLRIGIHVGDVIAKDGDIFGDAVNIASRIEPLAGAGGVTVSQQVYDQIYNKFGSKLESIGKHELKNVEAPVQVYRVVMPWEEEAPAGEKKRVLPLMDRKEEMEALRAAVDRAADGKGELVFLAGEAGIGKTRLATEVAGYARKKGFEVLLGTCHRREGNAPYSPWAELTREFVRERQPRDLVRLVGNEGSEIAKLVPEISDKIGPVNGLPAGMADQDRIRFFEGVTQTVRQVSKESPVLLVLEDLNWADTASLDLLQYFVRNSEGSRVLTLGTYRDVELEEESPLTEVVYELNREKLADSIRLKGLSPEDVSKMIGEYFGNREPVSDEFRDLIYQKTGGNPFFIEEILRSFVEQGVIYRANDGWERKPISEIQVPSGVKMVIKQRLDHLDQDCQGVLSVASVASAAAKDFSFDLLQKVTGMDDERLLDLMDRILKSRLIGEIQLDAGRSAYAFTDLRIRDALYEEMSLVRRSRYHLKAGLALEEIYQGRLGDAYGILAFHYLKGNEQAKCLAFSLKAAEEASKLYAHKEAAKYYQIALDLLEGSEDRKTTAGVLESLGDASWLSGSPKSSFPHYERAASLYEELGEKKRAARIYTKLGQKVFDFDRDEPVKTRGYYDRALALLQGEETEELASLYQNIARFDWLSGNFADSGEYSQKALALAKKLELPEVEAHVLIDMAAIAPAADREKSVQYHQRALEIGLEHDYLDVVMRAYNNLAINSTPEAELEYAKKGLEYAKRVGYVSWRIQFQNIVGDFYLTTGEAKKAEEIYRQVIKDAAAVWGPDTGFYGDLGSALLLKGDLKQSQGYLESWYSKAVGNDFQSQVWSEHMLGLLHLETGELARADQHLSKAWSLWEGKGLTQIGWTLLGSMYTLEELIRAEVAEGDLQRAKSHLDELKKVGSRTGDERGSALVHFATGRVLAAEGDYRSAAKEFEKALEVKTLHSYWTLNCMCELGSAYQKAGDTASATKILEKLLETSKRTGAMVCFDRATALLGQK